MISKCITTLFCLTALLGCSEQAREAPAGAATGPKEEAVGPVEADSKSREGLPDDFYSRRAYGEGDYPPADHADAPDSDLREAEFDAEPEENLAAESSKSDELAVNLDDDAVELESAADAAAFTVSEYVVVAGDTLSRIAREHDTTVQALMAANAIADADTLYVGQKLRIE